MDLLKYKGILFDEWTEEEEGVWSQICEKCKKKHKSVLKAELDTNGGFGACSVYGCDTVGADDDMEMYYIDFNKELIEYTEENCVYAV